MLLLPLIYVSLVLLNRTLWKTSSIAEEAFPVQNKNLSIYLSILCMVFFNKKKGGYSLVWPHLVPQEREGVW